MFVKIQFDNDVKLSIKINSWYFFILKITFLIPKENEHFIILYHNLLRDNY